MKFFYFSLLLLGFYSLSASHITGGEITWEAIGGNQIILKLKVYSECGVGAYTPTNNASVDSDIPGRSSISLNKVSQRSIVPDCMGGGLLCGGSAVGDGAFKIHEYESMPITLPSQIPASGFTFTWKQCCRQTNIVNIVNPAQQWHYVAATLYSNVGNFSSPEFISSDMYVSQSKSLSFMASAATPEDSLYYMLYAPLDDTTNSVQYSSGYSALAPFPNTATNAQNGNISFDSQTGLISYDINQGVSGAYVLGVAIEQWRDGKLMAVIRRDASVSFTDNTNNNIPAAFADTTGSAFNFVNGRYVATAQPGDTLSLQLSATDYDFNNPVSIPVPQVIRFKAEGAALDTTWDGAYNFSNPAVVTPVSPQVGYTKSLNNNVEFYWVVDNSHLHGAKTRYFFNMQFYDDACDYNGKVNFPLEVLVHSGTSISADSLVVCEGDSVVLSGSTFSGAYLWSPTTDMSDSTSASPKVAPLTSTFYYLEDPASPGQKDSVYVSVEKPGYFQLDSLQHQVVLVDSVQTGQRTWYYNGIPFQYPYDTLNIFGPGYLYVGLQTAACHYTTDTIDFTPGGSFAISDPNQGNLAGNTWVLDSSWGANFILGDSAAGNLQTIYLPGIDTSGEAAGEELALKIYDASGTVIWSLDTNITGFHNGVFSISLMQNLQPNVEYTLTVTGDSAYSFRYFEDLPALPFSPWNNGLSITGLYEGAAGSLPTQNSDKLLPVVLQVESTIGLDELGSNSIKVYPNPAGESITVEGLHPGQQIRLLDLQGKLIREITTNSTKTTINRDALPAGIYLLQVNQSSIRIIFN